MKKTFYIVLALLLIFCLTGLLAQNSRPIILNPSIGDTLSLSEKDYYQLFPKYEGFQFAVFYLNPDSTINAEVHYLNNGISTDTLIQNYKSLKSLNYQINARNVLGENSYLMESEYTRNSFDKGAEVSAYLNDGEVVTGELMSIKSNSLLILKQECKEVALTSDCAEDVSVSKINKLVIEGDSKIVGGIILGVLCSIAVAAVIYEANHTPSSFGPGIDESTAELMVLTTIGCIGLGVGIGLATSTPDEVIEPFSENDISGLRAYSRYQKND